MSRAGDRFFRSGPKLPPPEHGIKVKKAGLTWWGLRWIEALSRLAPGYASRLERGRTYARAGRTHDLVVDAGHVTAKVTGTRPKPYAVSLKLPLLPAASWEVAIAHMASQAQFSAELLGGQMPRAIDEAFASAGSSLFPVHASDLVTECSCPDWANPCKHVAAMHYVLGEALDRDPFLLFELRGRSKARVLSELRAARGGNPPTARDEPAHEQHRPVSALTLEGVSAADYDAARAPLPALVLDFEEPAAHGAVLSQLGKPVAWSGDGSPAGLLTPLVQAAAARARAIALAEAADVPSAAAPSPPPARAAPPPRRAKRAPARAQPTRVSVTKQKPRRKRKSAARRS